MEKFKKAGKINFNGWPKLPDESVEECLLRQYEFASQGILAPVFWDWDNFLESKPLESILDFWYDL